jgi:hypothetical protein
MLPASGPLVTIDAPESIRSHQHASANRKSDPFLGLALDSTKDRPALIAIPMSSDWKGFERIPAASTGVRAWILKHRLVANSIHQFARRSGNSAFRNTSPRELFSTLASRSLFNGRRDLAGFCEVSICCGAR